MDSHNTVTYRPLLLLIACLLFLSCKKEAPFPPTPSPDSLSGVSVAREVMSQLYTIGVPQIYLDTDPEEGVMMAWPAYLSGLLESEARSGYYPDLMAQRLMSPAIRSLAQRIYTQCFDGIELADSALFLIPRAQGLEAQQQAHLLGEAHFFRAFNRFYLVHTFGAVPRERKGGGTSLGESYHLIEQDLQSAIARLPSRAKVSDRTRVCRELARAMLGELYLQMSGFPLRQAKYKEAAAILRPIVSSGHYHLMPNGNNEEKSAFNKLRTTPHCEEYLFTLCGEGSATRASYTFPREARAWGGMGVSVAFNAFRPTKLLMSAYGEGDLRGKDRQYFHTFYKVAERGKTIFEVFDPAPWFWLPATLEATETKQTELGLYPYSEVLLLLAEASLESEEDPREAISYLAEVRARAWGQTPAEISQALSTLSREELRQEILLERLRELPFQMKQLWDIQRTRRYPHQRGSHLRLVPLNEAKTPQGHHLASHHLPLPASMRD